MSTKITIPPEHYVGMRQQNDSIPLAFITPNGTDKAAIKRIQTVDSWVGRDGLDSTVIINKPMHGFKLTCDIRRGGRYGSGDKWYIDDPRGFTLEISSSNLAYILNNCVIENGLILDQCIWGRQGGNNVLLATSTDLYENAVTLTGLDKLSISTKDLRKGNTVILKSGITALYLGKYYILRRSWTDNAWFELDRQQHVFISNDKEPKMLLYSMPKVSKISDTTELPDVEAEKAVNDHIANQYETDTWYPIYGGFAKQPITWKIDLKPVDDIDHTISSAHHQCSLIVELKNGKYGYVNQYYAMAPYMMDVLDVSAIDQGHLSFEAKMSKLKTNDYYERNSVSFIRSEIKNLYECYIQSTTAIGNQIEVKF